MNGHLRGQGRRTERGPDGKPREVVRLGSATSRAAAFAIAESMGAEALTAWVFATERRPPDVLRAARCRAGGEAVREVLLGAAFVQVTSAGDGTAHLVTFRLYEQGLMSGEGRYTAMCGTAVLAAAMATAPGRRCPLCRASLDGTAP